MAIVEIIAILNFDDDVQFWYTITVLLPIYAALKHLSTAENNNKMKIYKTENLKNSLVYPLRENTLLP